MSVESQHHAAVRTGIRPGIACLILVVSVALAYSNSFRGAFIFDDNTSIVEHPLVQRFSTVGSAVFPQRPKGDTIEGRPLLALSVTLNYALSGKEVWSYHAFNLLVHLAATLTLFGLVRRTLLLPKLRENYGPRATWLALAVALIWGLHPLQTESVTYIIQRAESLVSLFYLLTMYCVARANDFVRDAELDSVRDAQLAERPGRWLGLAVVCCLAGMASKEVMVTVPVMALLYERVFVFDAWRDLLRSRWQFYAALAASWLVLAACMVPLAGRGGSAGFGQGISSWHYLLTQAEAIVTYLRLAILPDNLVIDYGEYVVLDLADVWPQATLVVAMLLATLWALWRRPGWGYLGAWFFIILSPTSSFVPIVTQTMAEHRVYLALAGPVVLAVLAIDRWWQRMTSRLSARDRESVLITRGPLVALICVAALLGYRTWLRNRDYRSAVSIWHATAAKRPANPRAHLSLAIALSDAGDIAAALPVFDHVLRIDPDNAAAYYHRGRVLLELDDLSGAFADLSRSIEIKPLAGAYQNRGLVHCRRGEFEQGVADFDRALELDPELRIAYRNRALAHFALKHYDDSRRDIQRFRGLGGTPDDELARVEGILQRI